MKNSITVLGILFLSKFALSQNVALTSEISRKDGVVLYENKPFSGELYTYSESAKNDCSCTLKAIYIEGKRDGSYEEWYHTGKRKQNSYFSDDQLNGEFIEWYSNGQKKYSGEYVLNKKYGTHTEWNQDNAISFQEVYDNNVLIEQKHYYQSGNLKFHVRFDPKAQNLIYKKQLFENGIVKLEENYKNKQLHGIVRENLVNGKPLKKITYENGKEIEKSIYDNNGLLEESLLKKGNTNFYEYTKFNNEKIIERGDYAQDKKENIWIYYDDQGNRIKEIKYLFGEVVGEGSYKNNLKHGVWVDYHKDRLTQTNTTYNLGAQVEKKTFKISHLFSSNFEDMNSATLFEFSTKTGAKERVAISYDNSYAILSSDLSMSVMGSVKDAFKERMRKIKKEEINESTTIDKRIDIDDISVDYKTTNYVNKFGTGTITGYDAFITLNLIMRDADGKVLFSKRYNLNKSDKLLNSILNNAGQTYARSEEQAFNSALKSITFKKFFKKYFPIEKNNKKN